MRLLELNPSWIRYEIRREPITRVVGDVATWKEGDPTETVDADVEYEVHVEGLGAAQGIRFRCPHCSSYVSVTLEGRGATPAQGSRGADGKPTRWRLAGGSTFEDLTLEPSIDVSNHWHGYVTNGEIRNA